MSAKTNLGPRLELRTSQSLVMTQQLQQSIKLLQMNAVEVIQFIENQLEQNPFLDQEEEESASSQTNVEQNEAEEKPEALDATEESFLPEEWRESDDFRDGSELRTSITLRDKEGEALDFEDLREKPISLREHLLTQFMTQVAEPVERAIGQHLIDLVDEAGYVREELSAVAAQLGTDVSHVEQALGVLQQCDPTGVGARSLDECLRLQLKEKNRLDPAMECLLAHLHLLGEGNVEALKRKCGVDADDLKEMIAEIRALNPKPGLAYSHEAVETAAPDVTVKRDRAGNWHVELNAHALPRVLVNRRYYAKVAEGSKGEDRKYVTERLQEANWLVKALDQRANTILKVSTAIVAQQENFFRMGIHHLKPLTLKDIARDTGFHESTVSRVTTGKYMTTPRGNFELKYFFTSSVGHSAGGEDVSSQTVKHLIREMIEKEENKNVLSDDDLAEMLRKHSITIARRTVAKYREAMGIPSSTQRRRAKAIAS